MRRRRRERGGVERVGKEMEELEEGEKRRRNRLALQG